jgi:hypothetical protein
MWVHQGIHGKQLVQGIKTYSGVEIHFGAENVSPWEKALSD